MHLFLPSTIGADERDPKLRVLKYGMLARAASIHGIERITIYNDPDPKLDSVRAAELMAKHLRYAECPPYLRKALIPYDEDLQYANIMPALQIPSHGYSNKFREAVVDEENNGELTLNAGMKNSLTVYGDLDEGKRVTVKVVNQQEATIIDRDDVPGFWTFTVENSGKELGEALEHIDKPVIGTASGGDPVHDVAEDLETMDDLALVFGSAWRGLPAMIDRGNVDRDQFDQMVDFVPDQQTKTVRTEEAVFECLAVLDYLR